MILQIEHEPSVLEEIVNNNLRLDFMKYHKSSIKSLGAYLTFEALKGAYYRRGVFKK